jgi:hypothetical protein
VGDALGLVVAVPDAVAPSVDVAVVETVDVADDGAAG